LRKEEGIYISPFLKGEGSSHKNHQPVSPAFPREKGEERRLFLRVFEEKEIELLLTIFLLASLEGGRERSYHLHRTFSLLRREKIEGLYFVRKRNEPFSIYHRRLLHFKEGRGFVKFLFEEGRGGRPTLKHEKRNSPIPRGAERGISARTHPFLGRRRKKRRLSSLLERGRKRRKQNSPSPLSNGESSGLTFTDLKVTHSVPLRSGKCPKSSRGKEETKVLPCGALFSLLKVLKGEKQS